MKTSKKEYPYDSHDSFKPKVTFKEYDGEHRCVKCVFLYTKWCSTAKCTPEERGDKKRGYFMGITNKQIRSVPQELR